jgi:hypothetical protein
MTTAGHLLGLHGQSPAEKRFSRRLDKKFPGKALTPGRIFNDY